MQDIPSEGPRSWIRIDVPPSFRYCRYEVLELESAQILAPEGIVEDVLDEFDIVPGSGSVPLHRHE